MRQSVCGAKVPGNPALRITDRTNWSARATEVYWPADDRTVSTEFKCSAGSRPVVGVATTRYLVTSAEGILRRDIMTFGVRSGQAFGRVVHGRNGLQRVRPTV